MRGYNDGYDACSDGGSNGTGETEYDIDNGGSPQGGKTLEDYCLKYGDLVGKDQRTYIAVTLSYFLT